MQGRAQIVGGVRDSVLEDGCLLLDALDAPEEIVALDDTAEPAEEGLGLLRRYGLVGAEGVVRRERSPDGAKDLRAGAIGCEILGSDTHRDEDFRGPCAVVGRRSDTAARQSPSQAFCLSSWCDDANPRTARHACHLILRTSGPLNLCMNAYLALAHLHVPACAFR